MFSLRVAQMIWVRRVFEGDWACRCLGEEVRYSRQTGDWASGIPDKRDWASGIPSFVGIGPPAFPPSSGFGLPRGRHSLFRLPRGIGLALTGCTSPPSSPEGPCINEPVCLLHTFFLCLPRRFTSKLAPVGSKHKKTGRFSSSGSF